MSSNVSFVIAAVDECLQSGEKIYYSVNYEDSFNQEAGFDRGQLGIYQDQSTSSVPSLLLQLFK